MKTLIDDTGTPPMLSGPLNSLFMLDVRRLDGGPESGTYSRGLDKISILSGLKL
jgi:hypothetical protein